MVDDTVIVNDDQLSELSCDYTLDDNWSTESVAGYSDLTRSTATTPDLVPYAHTLERLDALNLEGLQLRRTSTTASSASPTTPTTERGDPTDGWPAPPAPAHVSSRRSSAMFYPIPEEPEDCSMPVTPTGHNFGSHFELGGFDLDGLVPPAPFAHFPADDTFQLDRVMPIRHPRRPPLLRFDRFYPLNRYPPFGGFSYSPLQQM